MRTTIVIAALAAALAAAPAATSQDADTPPTISVVTLKPAAGGEAIGVAHVRTTADGTILGTLLYTGLPAGQAVVWTTTDRCDGTLTTVVGRGAADSQGVLSISESLPPQELSFVYHTLKRAGDQGDVLACGTARSFRVTPTATERTGVVLTAASLGSKTKILAHVLAPPRGRAHLEAVLSGLRPGRTYGLALSRRACGSRARGGTIASVRFRASRRGTAVADLPKRDIIQSMRGARSVQVFTTRGEEPVTVRCAFAKVISTEGRVTG